MPTKKKANTGPSKKTPKKKAKVELFKRLTTTPVLHWATRATKPVKKDLPVHTKVLRVVSTSLEESARVSLALDLLTGKGSKELQSQFDTLAESNRLEFLEEYPDYAFSLGGRPVK